MIVVKVFHSNKENQFPFKVQKTGDVYLVAEFRHPHLFGLGVPHDKMDNDTYWKLMNRVEFKKCQQALFMARDFSAMIAEAYRLGGFLEDIEFDREPDLEMKQRILCAMDDIRSLRFENNDISVPLHQITDIMYAEQSSGNTVTSVSLCKSTVIKVRSNGLLEVPWNFEFIDEVLLNTYK